MAFANIQASELTDLKVAFVATPEPSQDDDSEAFYWLTIARRVLSGEIDPDNARAVLSARKKEQAAPRASRRSLTQH